MTKLPPKGPTPPRVAPTGAPSVRELFGVLSVSVEAASQRLGCRLALIPLEPWTLPTHAELRAGTVSTRLDVVHTTSGQHIPVMGAPVFGLPPVSVVLLGRGREASVRIDQPTVSRLHAELGWTGGQFHLRDLGSYNGTLLNGRQLGPSDSPVALVNGDVVTLGETQLLFGALSHLSGLAPAQR